ncbi:uncharacterized protein LOC126370525 isoform X2 [Pectinophora gossypiella]|uniref:uncharacterized protein LOC126370525 isoform X2 n=1 Tax=Pectinophora gossypiella TaxID=13191 RepID=UPI00214E5B71|nr:uncharacterized protein LOC126370525 isoform X2 [Pectinophora gossypiella]
MPADQDCEQTTSITALKQRLKGIKSWVSRLANEIETLTAETATAVIVQVKEERLRAHFTKYEECLLQIISVDPSFDMDVTVEQKYMNSLVKIKQLLSNRELSKDEKPVSDPISRLPVNLPPINIPTFTGKYTEYKTFIGIFNAVVHKDKRLEKIQKFYYFQMFLQGEPYNLIKNLPMLESSYDEALKIIDERYNNEFKIKMEHLNLLLDIQPLTKTNAPILRQFVSTIKQQKAALKNLNIDIETCPMTLCVILRKLDALCSREFQLTLDTKEPSLSTLIEFLDKRALALENSTAAMQLTKPPPASSGFNHRGRENNASATALKAIEDPAPGVSCLLCAEHAT